MAYLHERKEWPRFRWRTEALAEALAEVRYAQGLLLGKMRVLGFSLQMQATLEAMTEETVKSSAIEGEILNPEGVRWSFARRLGVRVAKPGKADRNVEGMVQVMMDATQNHADALTAGRLFGWHAALFPLGRSALRRIRIGAWREGKMQVVSGVEGNETIHLEGPAAARVPAEMEAFLAWFNGSSSQGAEEIPALIKCGLAHLYFLTIHPFDDGNGRIARAITELALARLEGSAQRFYALSAEIREQRADYYGILESTQKGELDVTDWLGWFLRCLRGAIERANALSAAVISKEALWRRLGEEAAELSERQRELINRLLDGFAGRLTTEKWAKMKKISHDSALRDIQGLMDKGVLKQSAGRTKGAAYALVDAETDER
jgi:Fic family protein